jgi:lysophospholipase L1-like esterase
MYSDARRWGGFVRRTRKDASLIRVAGVMVAFLVLSAASCTTQQAFSGSGSPTLQFVGDSITVQSTADINRHYGSTKDVAIDATVGVDTYIMAKDIAAQAQQSPDIEVINLGTNDAAHIENPPSYERGLTVAQVTARLDTFAAEFPSSTCVIFVTVNTHTSSTWGPAFAQEIDAHIRAAYPHVADWDAAWRPEFFDQAGGVHPNESGRQALLAVEDHALAGCPSIAS